jgi:phosphohistidine swiveling domain-containing protein
MAKELWVNNFSVHRSGYHLAAPVLYGIINTQKVLFGKRKPLQLKDYFFTFEGPNLTSAPHRKDQLRKMIESTITEIFNHSEKLNRIHKETYRINDRYFAFAKKCSRIDLKKLSDKELGRMYLELVNWQERAHQHALATTWYLDSDGEDFSKLLLEKTREFCHLSGEKINFADAFSALTTSPKETLAMKEEKEILQILAMVQGNRKAGQIFAKLRNYKKIPGNISPGITKAIERHFEKWRWLAFNYMGPAYEIDFFVGMLSDLAKQKTKAKEELKKKGKWPGKIRKKRVKIFKSLKIGREWQKIYDIAADIVNLKGYRKDICFHGFFVMDFMLREMSRRLGLARNQMYLLTFQEIGGIFLKNKKITADEINKRNKFTIMDYKNGKVRIFTGDKAKKYYSGVKIEKEKIDKNASEFRGTCACSGQVKGIVRLVNEVKDIPKMKKGDVMVAHTTFPNLVPAMKLASAIVTEDGGMTCHAAIIARELGTPCITGIKIATKVLKDGDLVEVDADKGVVRILRKYK